MTVELGFAEAARGVEVPVTVSRFSPCPDCGAAGGVASGRCAPCQGRGVRRATERVRLVIPAGVDSGVQIRMAGEGHAGPFGGPRGDLVVSTRVREHAFFVRKGDSVHCEVPVSVWEALRGARITVPTPAGATTLVVPPGTTPGQVFRLRGQGLPRLSGAGTGDLYVTVSVRDSPRARPADRRAGARPRATDSHVAAIRPRAVSGRIGVTDRNRPLYMIGVVAEMLEVHPQTLRFYEKKGLLRPSRSVGRTRLYSQEDVEELGRLLRLTRDMGVNLAGVEVILKMRRRMVDMQKQIQDLLAYVRETGGDAAGVAGRESRESLVKAAAGQLQPVDLF